MPVAFGHPDRIGDDGRSGHLDGVPRALDDERPVLVSLREDRQGEVRSREGCERVVRWESDTPGEGSSADPALGRERACPPTHCCSAHPIVPLSLSSAPA